MQYIISLILAALVYGQSEASYVSSADELCSVKALVFSVMTGSLEKNDGEIPLTSEKSVQECKKKSNAKVFREWDVLNENFSSVESHQIALGETDVDKINHFYKHNQLTFYDGFEFNIQRLTEANFERLLKERSKDQKFSLKMYFKQWSKVGEIIKEA
ncbi:hypothetical protein DSO57_1002376 [Entomophthora muscae]|uniref:Uncharacterized protein n=1 Tax=Entomophthora muscae TaxID=34485 RepID=A0ACC2RNN6_9FUNG|nr:hypothetical protein DSO57_1002376 [Entomophthora muscae]